MARWKEREYESLATWRLRPELWRDSKAGSQRIIVGMEARGDVCPVIAGCKLRRLVATCLERDVFKKGVGTEVGNVVNTRVVLILLTRTSQCSLRSYDCQCTSKLHRGLIAANALKAEDNSNLGTSGTGCKTCERIESPKWPPAESPQRMICHGHQHLSLSWIMRQQLTSEGSLPSTLIR